MTATGNAIHRIGRRAEVWILAWLWVWTQFVLLPEPVLATNLVVDDALYFALPAQHVWEGVGFSFDGIERTNGVQTLWALVCVAIAGVVSEPTAMLRVMVGLSGLCWAAAALLLYRWLRPWSSWAAMLAAMGFAWSGVHDRIAFQGMENGLHALLGMLALVAGTRAVQQGWTRHATLTLGLALAGFGLSRTEAVLLGPIVGIPLVLGWLGASGAVGQRVRLALWLAVPGVVLVGGACVASKIAFDSFLPISGSVKQFYETSWGGIDDPKLEAAGKGGFGGSLGYHLKFTRDLGLAPLREFVPGMVEETVGLGTRRTRNIVWIVLGISVVLAIVQLARRRLTVPKGHRFALCIAVYALIHVVVMGSLLPHFTGYGKWYFATEMTLVWIVLGIALASWKGGFVAVPIALLAVMTGAGLHQGTDLVHDIRTNRFRDAGLWLKANTEPDTVVGALSSGLLAWYASDQNVVNLDGLINNRRYLDEYLAKSRLANYFEDRGIQWFSDYQPLPGWKNGISWRGRIPARRLAPRRYWRLENNAAYVIWQVLPPDAEFELLGDDGPSVRDRYAELAVAAEVHKSFPVVLAKGFAPKAGQIVVRSIVEEPSMTLRHVLATSEERAAIGLTEQTVFPEHETNLEVRPGLWLLGYDLTESVTNNKPRSAFALYWVRRGEVEDGSPMRLSGGERGADVPIGTCHGTAPFAGWPAGQVITETVILPGIDLVPVVDTVSLR